MRASRILGITILLVVMGAPLALGQSVWMAALVITKSAGSRLGFLRSPLNRSQEAAVLLERARNIDLLAPYPYAMSSAGLQMMGRMDEALNLAEYALDFEPDHSFALWCTPRL